MNDGILSPFCIASSSQPMNIVMTNSILLLIQIVCHLKFENLKGMGVGKLKRMMTNRKG